MNNNIFVRIEKKFILTIDQKNKLLEKLNDLLVKDQYGDEYIYSLYYDNETDDVIRHSISRPAYKEKLRIRSYGINLNSDSNVYIELKKKYEGISVKRRVKIKYSDFDDFVKKGVIESDNFLDNEIYQEIKNHIKIYNVYPKIIISYKRESYLIKEFGDFRITFDSDISYRYDNLDFISKPNKKLLDGNLSIMELKFKHSIPYEISKLLTELKIYRSRFSKYGKIYLKELKEKHK